TSLIAAGGSGRWIEYAGGYTDMLSQRKPAGRGARAATASITKRPRPVTEVRVQPAGRPRQMSFKDRRALETLPARIAALQTQVARLNAHPGRPGPVCTRSGTVWHYDTGACRSARRAGGSRGAVADVGNAA